MKCKNCGAKVIRFPLKDEGGNLIVKNLFKMDLMSVIWVILIITLVISYKADINKCEEVMADPLKYCEKIKACKMIEERNYKYQPDIMDTGDIPEFDVGG